MTFSVNSRLILEEYKKGGLESNVRNGIATPGQRDKLKGLRVLVEFDGPNGRHIPVGSIAYLREEVLHVHGWASKTYTSDFLNEKFILCDYQHIDSFKTPDEAA